MKSEPFKLKSLLRPISWGVYSISGLICAFYISWIMLAKVDFAYGWFHDLLDIQQHNEQYGPANRFKQGFENTDKAEHVRIFSAINDAVHQSGRGLGEIHYAVDGHPVAAFLHEAEIQHLEDVANLIDFIHPLVIGVSVLWLVLLVLFRLGKWPMPGLKQLSAAIGGFVLLCSLPVWLIGPEKVFYAFHVWAFPEGHQWYFFYEESLMSTMMKAPDLFGAIAVLLIVVALVVFLGLNFFVSLSYHRRCFQ